MNRCKKNWEVRRDKVLLKHLLRVLLTEVFPCVKVGLFMYMNTSLKDSLVSNVIFFTLEDFNVTVVLS